MRICSDDVEAEERRWGTEALHLELLAELRIYFHAQIDASPKDEDVIDVHSEDDVRFGMFVDAAVQFACDET